MLSHSSLQLRFSVWWKTILILTESCSNNIAEYNALSIGMQIADEIGIKNLKVYSDSKLIVNQVREEYEVRYEDLLSNHRKLFTWQRGSETSTSTMYLASKMCMQMHWHLSLLPWLFQPERQRKYSSTATTCIWKTPRGGVNRCNC